MIDHQDWVESFENEADRESYERWLDSIAIEEMYNEAQVEKIMSQEGIF